ncbi:hypothetical protein QIS74_10826 [Colletotrichum tabaci]|uniref:Uncharacterized protein n=1 Tax=Colletotrichum tabaci TaxID=1209068 RepID=A0AAV9T1J2_9PEZI
MSSPLLFIINITLVGLVTLPAIVLTGLLFRRSTGTRRDPSRRWETYTKAAIGLYSFVHILYLTNAIIGATNDFGYYYGIYNGYFAAVQFLGIIALLFNHLSEAAIFLALFYLARALNLARADETSRRYRIGRKWALGAVIWICLGSVVVLCISLSIFIQRSFTERDNAEMEFFMSIYNRSVASASINLAVCVTNLGCAIGTMVYTAKARKKVVGDSLQKMSTLMLTCAILWLIRNVWMVLFTFFLAFAPYVIRGFLTWVDIIDPILNSWMTFVILALLFVLATVEKYALPRAQVKEDHRKSIDVEAL